MRTGTDFGSLKPPAQGKHARQCRVEERSPVLIHRGFSASDFRHRWQAVRRSRQICRDFNKITFSDLRLSDNWLPDWFLQYTSQQRRSGVTGRF